MLCDCYLLPNLLIFSPIFVLFKPFFLKFPISQLFAHSCCFQHFIQSLSVFLTDSVLILFVFFVNSFFKFLQSALLQFLFHFSSNCHRFTCLPIKKVGHCSLFGGYNILCKYIHVYLIKKLVIFPL